MSDVSPRVLANAVADEVRDAMAWTLSPDCQSLEAVDAAARASACVSHGMRLIIDAASLPFPNARAAIEDAGVRLIKAAREDADYIEALRDTA